MTQLLQLVRDDESENKEESRTFLAELFDRARRGELPRSRPLNAWEPLLLDERHLQMIMMRICGMKQCDIARAFNLTDGRVSVVLNHPDAHYIFAQLQANTATNLTSIESWLEGLIPRAQQAIEDLFDAEDLKSAALAEKKARVGFTILERKLPKATQPHTHEHRVSLDSATAGLLSRAIRESQQLTSPEYIDAEVLPESPAGGVQQLAPANTLPPEDGDPPPVAPQETSWNLHDVN